MVRAGRVGRRCQGSPGVALPSSVGSGDTPRGVPAASAPVSARLSRWHGARGIRPRCIARGCSLLVMEKFGLGAEGGNAASRGKLHFCSLAASSVVAVLNKWGLGGGRWSLGLGLGFFLEMWN